MRAAGVEVAQRDKMDAVRDGCPIEHPLHPPASCRRSSSSGARVSFRIGTLRLAVGGRRGREDDVLDAVLDHALEHRPRAAEVIIIILERIDHASADLRVRGKADDRVNFLGREHMIAELFVADIALIEPRLRMDGLAGSQSPDCPLRPRHSRCRSVHIPCGFQCSPHHLIPE